MTETAAVLAAAIGSRVRHERQARGWTLDQLAQSSGVSRRMLVNVEQGNVNPSVGTLLRLSDALGIGLPELVEPPERDRIAITRAGDGAVLWTGASGGCGVLLAGTVRPDVLELWEWRLEVGDVRESEAHSPGTKELVHVLQGGLVLQVGAETLRLSAGDAASFPGDVAHAYASSDGGPVRFALAVFEPGVGSPAHAEVADA
jgi:transcriptional regulator with XRE-family HTH domain